MTVRATVTLDGFASAMRNLGPSLAAAAKKGLVEGAHRLLAQVQLEIATTEPHQPTDTGAMAASWKVKRTERGAVLGNARPEALWIEVGRRPGGVSAEGFAHLVAWVRRKGLYLDALPKGTSKRPSRDAVQTACEHVAYAIKLKLEAKGYAPRFPLKRAITHGQHAVISIVLDNMRQVSP